MTNSSVDVSFSFDPEEDIAKIAFDYEDGKGICISGNLETEASDFNEAFDSLMSKILTEYYAQEKAIKDNDDDDELSAFKDGLEFELEEYEQALQEADAALEIKQNTIEKLENETRKLKERLALLQTQKAIQLITY